MREAKTGWPSVGLAPMITITSALSTDLEILGAGGSAERLLQAVAGRRMANARAGVDIVVVEGGADHLLHHIDFLIGAARRGDAADRADGRIWPGSPGSAWR